MLILECVDSDNCLSPLLLQLCADDDEIHRNVFLC